MTLHGAMRAREQKGMNMMEDRLIVDLYWARNESAITETQRKYGRMLLSLSYSLLSSREDAEECVNDTYLGAWNAMPTARPDKLGAFLSKITRRLSIDRFRRDHRKKRGGVENLTEELSECIPSDAATPFEELETERLHEALDRFLEALPKDRRVMFVQRYFYGCSVSRIAEVMGLTESNVKVTLHRVRESLRKALEREDLL